MKNVKSTMRLIKKSGSSGERDAGRKPTSYGVTRAVKTSAIEVHTSHRGIRRDVRGSIIQPGLYLRSRNACARRWIIWISTSCMLSRGSVRTERSLMCFPERLSLPCGPERSLNCIPEQSLLCACASCSSSRRIKNSLFCFAERWLVGPADSFWP